MIINTKLVKWAQWVFLAGIALLIVRNNGYPWPIKRASDILFFVSLLLTCIFIIKEQEWRVAWQTLKKILLPFSLIFAGLLVASLNGYFKHQIVVDQEGYLGLLRLAEAAALVFAVCFFQKYNSNFYKQAAVAQLSTIVYFTGFYFNWDTYPDRFFLLENFPSNVGYYLTVSLSLLYILLLNTLRSWRIFILYFALAMGLTSIMIWTMARGSWLGLCASLFVIIYYFWTHKKDHRLKNFALSSLIIIFCFIGAFAILPVKIKNLTVLRFFGGLPVGWMVGKNLDFHEYTPSQLISELKAEDKQIQFYEPTRPYIWRAFSKQLIKEPLGLGLSFPPLEYQNTKKGPHNTLLEFWALGGLLAVAGFLIAYYRGLKNIILKIKNSPDWQWQLYLVTSLSALFVASLFDNMNSFRLMWIIIGLAIAVEQPIEHPPQL